MKVFVSAYDCQPYKGSGPGIGWNFINGISMVIYNFIEKSMTVYLTNKYTKKGL